MAVLVQSRASWRSVLVDCSLCRDSSVKGLRMLVKCLESWLVGDPRNGTFFCFEASAECNAEPPHLILYLAKRLTILLHTKRLRYEPWREKHKLFTTQKTVWPTKTNTWTIFSLRQTSTAKTLSNAILAYASKLTTALTIKGELRWKNELFSCERSNNFLEISFSCLEKLCKRLQIFNVEVSLRFD